MTISSIKLPQSNRSLAELADFAVELAQRAGRLILSHSKEGFETRFKADGSHVTVADQQAEELLRREIQQRFPDDGLVGEEQGTDPGENDWTWIVDPIDGTASFVHGVPLFGVLIALEHRNVVKLGVIHLPALDETVWAWRGGGCWWNGRRAQVSTTQDIAQALLCLTDVPGTDYEKLVDAVGLRRTWGDCYGYALVATGRAEIMTDPIANVWDLAAVQPIVEEAGGRFSDLSGISTVRGGHALATNGHLHDQALQLLS